MYCVIISSFGINKYLTSCALVHRAWVCILLRATPINWPSPQNDATYLTTYTTHSHMWHKQIYIYYSLNPWESNHRMALQAIIMDFILLAHSIGVHYSLQIQLYVYNYCWAQRFMLIQNQAMWTSLSHIQNIVSLFFFLTKSTKFDHGWFCYHTEIEINF